MAEHQATHEASQAEKTVRERLNICGLPLRGSYTPAEVCKILEITAHVFWRLTKTYSRGKDGKLVRSDSLESFRFNTNRRVTYIELVSFFHRNSSWQRETAQKPQGGRQREQSNP